MDKPLSVKERIAQMQNKKQDDPSKYKSDPKKKGYGGVSKSVQEQEKKEDSKSYKKDHGYGNSG